MASDLGDSDIRYPPCQGVPGHCANPPELISMDRVPRVTIEGDSVSARFRAERTPSGILDAHPEVSVGDCITFAARLDRLYPGPQDTCTARP